METGEIRKADMVGAAKITEMKISLGHQPLTVSVDPADWDRILVGMPLRVTEMDRRDGGFKLTLAPTIAAPAKEPGTTIEIRVDERRIGTIDEDALYERVKQVMDFLDPGTETISMAGMSAHTSNFFYHPESTDRRVAIFHGVSRDNPKFFVQPEVKG